MSDADEVRYTAVMTRGLRNRLRAFCARINREMEEVGAEWIAARLDEEEQRLMKSPKPKGK